MNKICVVCGNGYTTRKENSKKQNENRIFCGYTCYWKNLKGKMPKSPPPHKPAIYINCKICSKKFKHKKKKTLLCSKTCFFISQRKPFKKCIYCHGNFTTHSGAKYFCSMKCFGAARKGKNSPSWKGGIKKDKDRRKSFECVEWKKEVLQRDGFTCQLCGVIGGSLVPHHIFFYSVFKELRCEISNGITLCNPCHKFVHLKMRREFFNENKYPEIVNKKSFRKFLYKNIK